MPHSLSVNYQHLIFVVKYRKAFIDSNFKTDLEKYITKLCKERSSPLLAIYAMPDHVHLLVNMNRNYSIAKFVQEIKAISSKFINERKFLPVRFEWQRGYASFSVSYSHVDRVSQYILNQKQHHHRQSFQDEYIELLKKLNLDIDNNLIFRASE